MKVLDLRCANGHGFEGWFASEDDFLSQNGRGLIECPLCADRIVTRMPSAPRLNLSGAREPRPAAESPSTAVAPAVSGLPVAVPAVPAPPELQTLWLQAVRHVLANTEDLGPGFAEEARRIHYGEAEARGIRGQATEAERLSLLDEGIEIMALPVPAVLKEPLQ